MARRGYTIYRRGGKGAFYVAWTDGTGRRRVLRASPSRAVASEIGRAKAAEADRVRSGVVDHAEVRAASAGREPIAEHLKAWKKSMGEKKNTAKHVDQSRMRAERVLDEAGVKMLSDLRAEPIQSALASIADQSSPHNAKHYLTALRMFVRYCTDTGRLAVNPIPAVKPPKAAGKTFKRTPIDADQLGRLLVATTARKNPHTPVGNIDRAMYYRVMAYTGLRLSEARSLTPESFDLGEHPSVTVRAAYSKHRRDDTIPISREMADLIKPWLRGRPRTRPVFPIAKWANLARIFQRDCAAAGIKAGTGERLGIHSLRRFFITSVVRAGGLAVGQDLARHSTPTLTKDYTDLTIADRRKAIGGLPPVRVAVTLPGKAAAG